ncbi:MAG: MFS transporter [Dehalococcoidia bacterium]|nr:MFS transporter [Dehalococcoidia bacterium]
METGVPQNTSKRITLFVAATASFATTFMGSSINIALPSIGREFDLDAVMLGWIATSYLLAAAIFLVPFGRIADIHGRKKVFIYGIVIFTFSSLLSAFSPSAVILILLRVLQGFGGAMIYCTGIAMIASVFSPGERGKALGISVAATYMGLSLGPVLGGLLTQHSGWRSIFLAVVPLGLAVIVAVLWKMKGDWVEARGEKFDLAGSVVLSLALVAMMYGLSLLPAVPGVWLIVTGILGIAAFVWWEMRVESPVLNVGLFRDNAVFAFSNLTALLHYSATFAVIFFLSLYLQYIKGLSPAYAGLVLISQPVVMAIFSPVAGRLSDRVEPRWVASGGMALTAIGLGLLHFLKAETPLEFIIAVLSLIGFGAALFSSPNTNAVMSSVDTRFYGVASATMATLRQVGHMTSMGIAMLLLSLYMGKAQITPEYYQLFLGSMKTAFLIFAALCFAGIFTSLARGKTRR